MANEFKVKNGLIVIGDLTTSGTITINGALAATQSWVTSQAYLTSASLSGYATQSYVTSAISALIDAAPAALDTLNELAAALGDDASFSTTVTNSIAGKVAKSGDTMTGSLTFASTADNVRLQKNSSFLNLRDPYNNIHLYNAGDGTYIDANVHHWRSQGASYWMTLNGTGLGIGTTSPNKQLTFAQANDDAIQIRRLTTSQGNTSLGTGISWTWTSAGTDNETWAAIRVIMPGNSNSIMTFSTTPDSGAAGLTERMRITDTGNVGIGTSTPSQKFVVSNGSSEVFKVYGGGEVVAGTNYIYAAYSSGTSFYAQGPASFRNGIHNDTNTYLKIDGGTSGFTYFSGNVGIGTTSPGAKIHLVPTGTQIGVIVDGTSVTADTANKVLDVLYNGGSSAFSVRSNGIVYIGYDYLYVEGAGITRRYYDSRIQFGTADLSSSTTGANVEVYGGLKVFKNVSNSSTSEIFRITNGGNVGIGTTSPESKLHVAGGPITLKGGSSTDQQILFNYAREYVQGIYNGSGHFRLQDNSLGGTVYQWDGSKFVFPNGNVGIGTSTIYAKLSISSGNYNGIRIDTNGGGYSALNIGGTGALTVDAPGITGGRFQITDSGNVGIGTPSPATKLHIVSTSTTELRLENSDASSNHGFVKYETQNSSGGNLIIGTNASGGGYGALLFTANNNVDFVGGGDLRIVKSGSVGIGTYSPSGKLTVAAGASYGITASSSQRYLMQALNTSNNVNSAYGWWWFHDNNSNMGFHADGIGDILTLTRGGTAIMLGGHTMWHAGNDGSGSGLDADTLDGLHASSFLLSNFGNVEGEHSFGYPSSDGWYKIAEVVLNGTCQSYNLWGEYRDTGYFDNSHYRIHITARAECDFLSNNESHAINVNIYGSSTNETYFTNNVRIILTSSSSNYRKYELQYYRATWDTGSWRLQTLGWTTYATSQTAGTSTGTPRVYYISKFVADNIYAANKISIGTSYSGFAANIAGTTYIIGGSVWTQNGYGFTNSGSNNTGMFPDSNHVITFKNNNSDNVTINASGNVGIGTSSPAQKLHVEGIARLGGSTTDGALYVYSSNGTLNSLISGPGNTYLNATYGNVGVGVNPTSGDKLEVAGSVRIHTGNNWDGIHIYAGGQDGYIRGIGDEVGLHIRSEYGNVLLADDRGRVGIGFTTPQKKLDVYGTGIVASFGGAFGPGDFAGIHFGYSESNSNNDIYKKSALVFERTDNHNQGGNASGKIHFLLNNAVSTSANSLTHSVVTIDSDANGTVGSVRMGIGTRNPSYPLEVNGGATSNNIARFTTGGVGGGTRGLTMYSDNSQLKLQVSDNVGGIGSWAFLNLNPDGGNVGIGTTAPDEKLQVAGNIKIQNETGLITDYGPLVGRYNTSQVYVGTGGNYSIVKIGRADGGALNVLSGGNVGIGTSTPSEKLEVNGNAYISGQSFLRSHFSSYTTDGLFNANALWSGVLTPSGVYRVRFGYLDQGGGQYWGRVGFVGNTNWSLGTAQGGHSFSIGTGNGNSEFLINNAGKVSIGTTDTNSDKSDFTVYTGGNTSIALAGNLFRVGESDINWDIALRQNGVLQTYAQNLYLNTAAGNYPVVMQPNGTSSVEFYQDYTLFNGLNLAISRTNSTHGATNYFRGDASHLVIGTGGTLYLNYGGSTTIVTGNATVSGYVGVTGIVSANARKLSLGILDLNTSGVPGQFKIKTSIPWNYGGSDFTVNIKGFRYGSAQMVSLSIGWHFYADQFYNRNAISNGAWAPTISLAKSPDGYVIIHLPSPDYWAKLYVESVYSSNSADSYTSGWSWSDADLSDCTLIQTVPYRDLATNISGNAATATFATTAGALSSMNISQFTNNSGYITSYTETDTLQSVTSRGSSTNTTLTSTNTLGLNVNSGSHSYININSTSNWSWVRLSNNGSTRWDIASYDGDALQFRPYGSGDNAMYLNLDGSLFINSLNDGKLNLRVPSGDSSDWNYINFIGSNGVRDTYFGTDSGGTPTWWRDDNGVNITLGSSVLINGNTAWHAGNDGSGSGLDADTVDGVQADSIVYGNARGTNDSVTTNNNDLDKTGYYTSDSFATKPSGVANWMYIEHIKLYNANTAYQKQLGYDTYDDRMWVRTKSGGAWSSWKQIWTSDSLTNLSQLTNGPGYITSSALSGYATTSYVTTQINNLINGAPGALDTLSELASALGNDASFATTVTNSIAGKVSKSGDTITSGNQQVLVLSHSANTADFNDALFLNNTTSDQQVQIGMAATGSDGNHHRVSLRAYKGTQPLEGVFGIALRQPGSAAHTQRLTLDYLGNLTIGGALTESSSFKLKENIETSEGNLEKVVNLRPVTYNKIGSQTTELGLIAEEVAEVYPEFVQYDENGEPVGVHYSRLTAALIGAVKELTNQVQELNKKING